MARKITQRQLRNESGEIMRALDSGESLVVTRSGIPVGRLEPVKWRRLVAREAVHHAFSGAPALDADRFRADVDRFLDQDPTPRRRFADFDGLDELIEAKPVTPFTDP